jgi:hypothetical protein
MPNDDMAGNGAMVIFDDGEHVNVPGPYNNRPMGMRGGGSYRGGGPPRGMRRGGGGGDANRMRTRSENYSGGEEDSAPGGGGRSRNMSRNAQMPSRPLTRVVARARTRSLSSANKGGQQAAENNQAQVNGTGERANGLPDRDAYRMEVNEYVPRAGGNGARPVPCVTVRDMHTFIPERKQRRIWVPVAVCDDLVRALKKCKGGENGQFDVSKLEVSEFKCPVTNRITEIEHDAEQTRLRTYMDVPNKADYKDGDLIEVIELRNELMGRLIKFLEDVATRYRKFGGQMTIPSLYSYSGERRFYFDLRDTRWGHRLHISQVTDLHRNVIGIPLETVIDFRDRLNLVIDQLKLENGDKMPNGRQRTTSGKKKSKKNMKGRTYNKGKKAGANSASSDEATTKTEPEDTTASKADESVKVEKQGAGDAAVAIEA